MTVSPPAPTRRAELLARLAQPHCYDLAVIGGGATGLGVALDAAARGFSVVLVDSHDFAKGTSSRGAKLVHGGVRYLARGNIALVREALHERTTLLHNAPHLAQPLPFVMPSYRFWETPFYGVGLMMYDALAGKAGLGSTQFLGRESTLRCLPTARTEGLKGGVKYWDGQFDDARLALALARTAASLGALVVNYCPAKSLVHEAGKVVGFVCEDADSGQQFTVPAGQSILDCLIEHGCDPLFDCKRGECGVCSASVIEGEPEHRDYFLSDAEKAGGKVMQICVSRVKGRRLVLDL